MIHVYMSCIVYVMYSVCQAYRHYKTKHAECIYVGKINPIYIFYPSYIQRTVVLAQAPPSPRYVYYTEEPLCYQQPSKYPD